MDQRLLIVAAAQYLRKDPRCKKLIETKASIPLGDNLAFISSSCDISVRIESKDAGVLTNTETKLYQHKKTYALQVGSKTISEFKDQLADSSYIFFFIEGSEEEARLVIKPEGSDDQILTSAGEEIRLGAYGLPPVDFICIETKNICNYFYKLLSKKNRDLFSVHTSEFLSTPHILTSLFAHVMSLRSRDHVPYVSNLRKIADALRQFLEPSIVKLTRDHQTAWAKFYGERIGFADGGMSRIISLPSTEPMGIRVGLYSVVPGEVDADKREDWQLYSYVIGDVLSERATDYDPDIERTDSKRLQEAARYLLEPLSVIKHLEQSSEEYAAMLIHGPLQNPFETYDDQVPYFLPAVNTDFLDNLGITMQTVTDSIDGIPPERRRKWNQCIPIYAYIMRLIFRSDTPILGVVERSSSHAFTRQVLFRLVREGKMTASLQKKLLQRIRRFAIDDEFLFGCILDEGEYIEPLELPKNLVRRAHDEWKPVVEQFKSPYSTILKTAAQSFPFRIEFNGARGAASFRSLLKLVYHTARLLPGYAFPVGVDIADKYAKIPDWLSKGMSATLTANILNRVLQKGDERVLQQVRQLLARSPRDFFFRPKF